MSFREESDEASPFRAERVDVALSVTVMEEGNADQRWCRCRSMRRCQPLSAF
jgi:hypothetical protein